MGRCQDVKRSRVDRGIDEGYLHNYYRSNSYFMICMVQSTPYHGAALIIIIIIIHNHYEFFDDIRDTSYTCAAAWITRCDHGIN